MQPDSPALLWDALDAAESILQFLDDMSWEGYRDDLLRR